MTSTSIYTPITPTYLYIKKHSITGLKYFGKTSRDPYKYQGSGEYWVSHIKKHKRKFIETLWVSDLYYDTSISEHALHFSQENNIVESNDWANLIPENGLNGGATGRVLSEKTKSKISAGNKGKKRTKEQITNLSIVNTGKTLSKEIKDKISAGNKGKIIPEEQKIKLSIANKGKIRITNGIINLTINKDEIIPVGFRKGLVQNKKSIIKEKNGK